MNGQPSAPGRDPDPLSAQLITRLRRLGLGERVLKTALAAGVSWQLAVLVPGNDHPYLAPVSAVLVMQLTIAQSIDRALQRSIGMVIGVLVAIGAYALFGISSWSIALVVLIALAGGIQLRLGQQEVQQVAIIALIVLLAGSTSGDAGYAVYRIGDSLIGAAVALALNWLVAPPIHVARARWSIERMADGLARLLMELTASLRAGMNASAAEAHLRNARALADSLVSANAALAQAEQSLRFNRSRRRPSDDLSTLRDASLALEHSAIHTRVITRSIAAAFEEGAADWIAPDHFGRALADLFGRNTALVRRVGGDRTRVRPELAITAELHEQMRDYWQIKADRGWLYAGEVLAVAERMAKELQDAIDVIEGDARLDTESRPQHV